MRPLCDLYLDNAATTFPKPPAVVREVCDCLCRYCGNPGRGSHALAMASAEAVYTCREAISRLIGLDAPENILFTLNTTYALNLLIKGYLKKGDHVLISDLEHNSVLRPIWRLAQEGIIEFDIFPSYCLDPKNNPTRVCAGIAARLRPSTKMVICTHASNICSYHMPLAEIGEFCRQKGVFFAVDAAQSAGHIPIDMKRMHIGALCAPAHKGLYGTQGCGFLALADAIALDTLVEGGNGVYSLEPAMPQELPERFESGTLCVPAIAALERGIAHIEALGIENIMAHEMRLYDRLYERLSHDKNITVYAPRHRGGVLLFNIDSTPSETVASRLADAGICVRGGYHCSPLGHKTLETGEGGAVRVSFGIYNTVRDIDRFTEALFRIKHEFCR